MPHILSVGTSYSSIVGRAKAFFMMLFLILPCTSYSADFASVKKYQDMLYSNQFNSLEKAIAEVEANYRKERSLKNERELSSVYRVFNFHRVDSATHLDRWVESSPDSPIPYIARGIYKYNRAAEARGTRYINKTSKEQLGRFHNLLLESQKDLEAALKIDPGQFTPYLYLMDAAKSGTFGPDMLNQYFNAGLKLAPENYELHLWYALNIRPIWGGTKHQWDTLGKIISKKIKKFPHLDVVNAVILYENARKFGKKGEYAKALKLVDRAISLASAADFYNQKFYILSGMNRYEESRNALFKAVEIKPGRSTYLVEFANMSGLTGDFKGCVEYADRAIYRGDQSLRIGQIRQFCVKRLK